MPHLYVALSAHGYGHLAQVAPVISALATTTPQLKLTVQTILPADILQSRISHPFTHINTLPDVAIEMSGPTDIQWEATFNAYHHFHRDWETHLTRQIQQFQQSKPDLLLADIPYLPLFAAEQIGLPSIALCSLNWLDILQANPATAHQLHDYLPLIRHAYQSAQHFIQPQPSMPMPWLDNSLPINPVAQTGKNQRRSLLKKCNLPDTARLVVVSLGGIPLRNSLSHWPIIDNLYWITPPDWKTDRRDIIRWDETDLTFNDLIASCDLIISKPGYGTFVEAACNGLPILYASRRDWAESVCLENWLKDKVHCQAIEMRQLETGHIKKHVLTLLEKPRKPAITPSGNEEAASIIQQQLPK